MDVRNAVATKPANLTFDEAAAVPVAALTASQGPRDHGKLQPGQKVLVNGASGGVGTFAVQIAKALGGAVTAVCRTRNVDLVRSIGADHVVDYTCDDFTRDGRRYDLMLDVAGSRSWGEYERVLAPDATVVMAGVPMGNRVTGPLRQILAVRPASLRSSRRVVNYVAKLNRPDLQFLAALLEAGEVKPVVERTYDLGEAREALRYMGEGHARGKVVITV